MAFTFANLDSLMKARAIASEDDLAMAIARRDASIAILLAIAESTECRLAVRLERAPVFDPDEGRFVMCFDHAMLLPGESAPSGWLIYERHAEGWKCRSNETPRS